MIISSRPPEVIGHFDCSSMSPMADSMRGSYEFVVADSVAVDTDPSHEPYPQYEMLKTELEPLWSVVDKDFRQSNNLDPSQPVNHDIRIRNSRTEIPRAFAKDRIVGIPLHIDAKVEDVDTTRYVMHSTCPTVFLLGERWFAPLPVDKLPKHPLLAAAAYTITHMMNSVALSSQSRHGLVYQPLPGEIVKIEGQVHASPEHRSRSDQAGKIIEIDSYIAE